MTISREVAVGSSRMRSVLARYPTGVAVIAAVHDGRPVGMCVGSFASVSLTPPLVGFLADQSSTTWPLIRQAGTFAVSVLREDQAELARGFAAKGKDRFHGVSWRPGRNGNPLIEGAVVTVECDICDVVGAGDHWFVTGSVLQLCSAATAGPLVFHGGGFARLHAKEPAG